MSIKRFSIGVPVSTRRFLQLRSRAALAALESGFFNLLPFIEDTG